MTSEMTPLHAYSRARGGARSRPNGCGSLRCLLREFVAMNVESNSVWRRGRADADGNLVIRSRRDFEEHARI